MKQPRAKLAHTISDKTLKGVETRGLSREIAAYLLNERRTGELESILRDVQADWAAAGIVEVLAESAHELTASIKAEIEREVRRHYPQAKSIIVTEIHNPEIIGGVRLNLPHRQLDLSIEAKLNKFKQLTQGKD